MWSWPTCAATRSPRSPTPPAKGAPGSAGSPRCCSRFCGTAGSSCEKYASPIPRISLRADGPRSMFGFRPSYTPASRPRPRFGFCPWARSFESGSLGPTTGSPLGPPEPLRFSSARTSEKPSGLRGRFLARYGPFRGEEVETDGEGQDRETATQGRRQAEDGQEGPPQAQQPEGQVKQQQTRRLTESGERVRSTMFDTKTPSAVEIIEDGRMKARLAELGRRQRETVEGLKNQHQTDAQIQAERFQHESNEYATQNALYAASRAASAN